VVSHTGRGTGFGRVAAGIAKALSSEHDVHVVGLGNAGSAEPWVGYQHDPVLDPTHTAAAGGVVRTTRPAAVVLVGEGDLIGWIATRLRRDGFAGAIVAYVPIEGPVLDPAPFARLHNATAVVAYTRVGAAVLLEAMAAPAGSDAVPDVAVIPHAIDPVTPAGSGWESRERIRATLIRAALIPDAGSVSGPWLLNANRNDWRKRPELTMRAFAPIAERHPDARLVMHCNPRRHDMDLRIERARLDLGDRVVLTLDENQQPWPEERLSRLYASCEIGVSSTMAEAWGLVAFEHALHGAAQVMPRHAGLAEIWGDAPLWVPLGQRTRVDMTFGGGEPQVDALTAILLNLIQCPQDIRSAGQACQRRAVDPSLSWETVGTQWLTLIAKVLNGRPDCRRTANESLAIRSPRATA
jgi:D-inositol-3-phosphate glycosyltransferase